MQLFCSHSHTRSLPFSHLLPNFRSLFSLFLPYHIWATYVQPVPIRIWVDIAPKSEKSRKKWQNIFCILVLYNVDDKISLIVFLDSRTRVRARLPTAMLIFCCHKCHTKGKFWWKNWPFLEGRKRNKNDFWLAFSVCFPPLSPLFIKIYQKNTVETWFIAHCI